MKRVVWILSVCGCMVVTAIYSTAHEIYTYDGLHSDSVYVVLSGNLDEAVRRSDSLSRKIASMRELYASSDTDRETVGKQIVALESEAYKAKVTCDKARTALAEYQQRWLTTNFGKTAESNAKSEVTIPESESNVTANLIYNEPFKREISSTDYASLCEAQERETDVADAIAEYGNVYASMKALQMEYIDAETEPAADSIKCVFMQLKQSADAVERNIERMWTDIYDNKLYAYNLLMEKCGRNDIIADEETKTNEVAQNIAEGRGVYSSDVILDYYYKKRHLLSYESQIASAMNIAPAKDSLATVATNIKNVNYRAAKIELEERNFIEYEPIKVVKPTMYNSKNPIPKTKIYEHGSIYRIRIGVFTNRPNVLSLRGITPLSYTDTYYNGRFAYFVGGFRTESEAEDGVVYLKRLGFKDPQTVVWIDGEYITELDKIEYSVEITGITTMSNQIKDAIASSGTVCEISRVGNKFVVGKFTDKNVANDMAVAIAKADMNASAKVVRTVNQ